MSIRLSEGGERTRAAIVDLMRERERHIHGRCHRTRRGLQAMVVMPDKPLIETLSGLDDHGWNTWIEIQRLCSRALSGKGGIDAIQLACDDLEIPRVLHD